MAKNKKPMEIDFFQGCDDQWYWRVISGNHRIVAVGGEGYSSKSNVKRGFLNFMTQQEFVARDSK